jgi:hypothetical protein
MPFIARKKGILRRKKKLVWFDDAKEHKTKRFGPKGTAATQSPSAIQQKRQTTFREQPIDADAPLLATDTAKQLRSISANQLPSPGKKGLRDKKVAEPPPSKDAASTHKQNEELVRTGPTSESRCDQNAKSCMNTAEGRDPEEGVPKKAPPAGVLTMKVGSRSSSTQGSGKDSGHSQQSSAKDSFLRPRSVSVPITSNGKRLSRSTIHKRHSSIWSASVISGGRSDGVGSRDHNACSARSIIQLNTTRTGDEEESYVTPTGIVLETSTHLATNHPSRARSMASRGKSLFDSTSIDSQEFFIGPKGMVIKIGASNEKRTEEKGTVGRGNTDQTVPSWSSFSKTYYTAAKKTFDLSKFLPSSVIAEKIEVIHDAMGKEDAGADLDDSNITDGNNSQRSLSSRSNTVTFSAKLVSDNETIAPQESIKKANTQVTSTENDAVSKSIIGNQSLGPNSTYDLSTIKSEESIELMLSYNTESPCLAQVQNVSFSKLTKSDIYEDGAKARKSIVDAELLIRSAASSGSRNVRQQKLQRTPGRQFLKKNNMQQLLNAERPPIAPRVSSLGSVATEDNQTPNVSQAKKTCVLKKSLSSNSHERRVQKIRESKKGGLISGLAKAKTWNENFSHKVTSELASGGSEQGNAGDLCIDTDPDTAQSNVLQPSASATTTFISNAAHPKPENLSHDLTSIENEPQTATTPKRANLTRQRGVENEIKKRGLNPHQLPVDPATLKIQMIALFERQEWIALSETFLFGRSGVWSQTGVKGEVDTVSDLFQAAAKGGTPISIIEALFDLKFGASKVHTKRKKKPIHDLRMSRTVSFRSAPKRSKMRPRASLRALSWTSRDDADSVTAPMEVTNADEPEEKIRALLSIRLFLCAPHLSNHISSTATKLSIARLMSISIVLSKDDHESSQDSLKSILALIKILGAINNERDDGNIEHSTAANGTSSENILIIPLPDEDKKNQEETVASKNGDSTSREVSSSAGSVSLCEEDNGARNIFLGGSNDIATCDASASMDDDDSDAKIVLSTSSGDLSISQALLLNNLEPGMSKNVFFVEENKGFVAFKKKKVDKFERKIETIAEGDAPTLNITTPQVPSRSSMVRELLRKERSNYPTEPWMLEGGCDAMVNMVAHTQCGPNKKRVTFKEANNVDRKIESILEDETASTLVNVPEPFSRSRLAREMLRKERSNYPAEPWMLKGGCVALVHMANAPCTPANVDVEASRKERHGIYRPLQAGFHRQAESPRNEMQIERSNYKVQPWMLEGGFYAVMRPLLIPCGAVAEAAVGATEACDQEQIWILEDVDIDDADANTIKFRSQKKERSIVLQCGDTTADAIFSLSLLFRSGVMGAAHLVSRIFEGAGECAKSTVCAKQKCRHQPPRRTLSKSVEDFLPDIEWEEKKQVPAYSIHMSMNDIAEASHRANDTTKEVFHISKYLVIGTREAAAAMFIQVKSHLDHEHFGKKFVPVRGVRHLISSAGKVALATAGAAFIVTDTIFEAMMHVGRRGGEITADVVRHRFGEKAGRVLDEATQSVDNSVRAVRFFAMLEPTHALPIVIAKNMGRRFVPGEVDMSENLAKPKTIQAIEEAFDELIDITRRGSKLKRYVFGNGSNYAIEEAVDGVEVNISLPSPIAELTADSADDGMKGNSGLPLPIAEETDDCALEGNQKNFASLSEIQNKSTVMGLAISSFKLMTKL